LIIINQSDIAETATPEIPLNKTVKVNQTDNQIITLNTDDIPQTNNQSLWISRELSGHSGTMTSCDVSNGDIELRMKTHKNWSKSNQKTATIKRSLYKVSIPAMLYSYADCSHTGQDNVSVVPSDVITEDGTNKTIASLNTNAGTIIMDCLSTQSCRSIGSKSYPYLSHINSLVSLKSNGKLISYCKQAVSASSEDSSTKVPIFHGNNNLQDFQDPTCVRSAFDGTAMMLDKSQNKNSAENQLLTQEYNSDNQLRTQEYNSENSVHCPNVDTMVICDSRSGMSHHIESGVFVSNISRQDSLKQSRYTVNYEDYAVENMSSNGNSACYLNGT